jgi:hypothetical protein
MDRGDCNLFLLLHSFEGLDPGKISSIWDEFQGKNHPCNNSFLLDIFYQIYLNIQKGCLLRLSIAAVLIYFTL